MGTRVTTKMSLLVGLIAALCFAPSWMDMLPREAQAEEKPEEKDRWVGTYHQFDFYQRNKAEAGQQVPTRKITKDEQGYHLEGYPHFTFIEVEKGILQDGKEASLGRIYLGETKYADGRTARTLEVSFCYESYLLYEPIQRGTAYSPRGEK